MELESEVEELLECIKDTLQLPEEKIDEIREILIKNWYFSIKSMSASKKYLDKLLPGSVLGLIYEKLSLGNIEEEYIVEPVINNNKKRKIQDNSILVDLGEF